MDDELILEHILNKPFRIPGNSSDLPCWIFCRHIYLILGYSMPASIAEMKKIEKPRLHSIVLFKTPEDWHTGIVWPDCLHFIHVVSRGVLTSKLKNNKIIEKPKSEIEQQLKVDFPIARKDRLTDFEYEKFIDGYYILSEK